jgi:L-asparaginase / beta-aspartyl-peptidase
VDAVIMDGATLHFGAVAAVQYVLHPITLARIVMTDTPHGFLVGRGAERLARGRGLTVPLTDLLTEEAMRVWHEARGVPPVSLPDTPAGNTVGAVAVDESGHVAAATSTGGTCNKWPGRVGDTPIVGAGAYADDYAGAVSCTGFGEHIMRVCMAFQAAGQMLAGASPEAAAQHAVALLTERTGGEGGLIVVGPDGRLGWAWNTDAMPYAWRDDSGQGEGL